MGKKSEKRISEQPDYIRENLPRWNGKTKEHYEVWYLTGNANNHGFWIRYTLNISENGLNDWAGVWCAVFKKGEKPIGICRKYPLSEFKWEVRSFRINIGESNIFSEKKSEGKITVGNISASWELNFEPTGYIFRHLPDFAYYLPVDTVVLSPNPNLIFSGYITLKDTQTGEIIKNLEFSDGVGYQTHIWGKKHAYKWVWGHSNFIKDENGNILEDSFFEGLTVVEKTGPLRVPPINIFTLKYKNNIYEFNGIKDIIFNSSKWKYGEDSVFWEIRSKKMNFSLKMNTKKDNFIMAIYDDPGGDKVFCHNSEVESTEISFELNGKTIKLFCDGTFHTEFGSRTPLEYNPAKFIYE
ncbi:MAG: hypothetical protein NZ927_08770 [Candidatus Calescibacterium sp.]|nr:hypothetical protein [Candidatus Calescibacterium sp.]MCX7734864.1 hypothetical protein [bacterium]MDW8087892.1 hypothetical protein [Candidatus Calescibacterium sp.]